MDMLEGLPGEIGRHPFFFMDRGLSPLRPSCQGPNRAPPVRIWGSVSLNVSGPICMIFGLIEAESLVFQQIRPSGTHVNLFSALCLTVVFVSHCFLSLYAFGKMVFYSVTCIIFNKMLIGH